MMCPSLQNAEFFRVSVLAGYPKPHIAGILIGANFRIAMAQQRGFSL
tara:strand:- start:713 stop:853 length:141 start_codon:yes stop_codon:yes gene_type:complete